MKQFPEAHNSETVVYSYVGPPLPVKKTSFKWKKKLDAISFCMQLNDSDNSRIFTDSLLVYNYPKRRKKLQTSF
jgi:hypothetical protein